MTWLVYEKNGNSSTESVKSTGCLSDIKRKEKIVFGQFNKKQRFKNSRKCYKKLKQ